MVLGGLRCVEYTGVGLERGNQIQGRSKWQAKAVEATAAVAEEVKVARVVPVRVVGRKEKARAKERSNNRSY